MDLRRRTLLLDLVQLIIPCKDLVMGAELTCQVIRDVMEGVSVFDYVYSYTVSRVAFYRVLKSGMARIQNISGHYRPLIS